MKWLLTVCSIFLLLSLSGCSSPPKPVQPKFGGEGMNKTFPFYEETKGVISAPMAAGEFELVFTRYNDEKVVRSNSVQFYYAVAHAKTIMIVAEDLDEYTKSRQWLEDLGAKCPIHFKQQKNLLKNTATIMLSSKEKQFIEELL